jgi:hypothetical protein
MLEKAFLVSLFTTILYGLFRFIEMKYINKKQIPLKLVVRDVLIVSACVFIGSFAFFSMDSNIYGLLNVVTDNKTVTPATTQVFTDEPGF